MKGTRAVGWDPSGLLPLLWDLGLADTPRTRTEIQSHHPSAFPSTAGEGPSSSVGHRGSSGLLCPLFLLPSPASPVPPCVHWEDQARVMTCPARCPSEAHLDTRRGHAWESTDFGEKNKKRSLGPRVTAHAVDIKFPLVPLRKPPR